MSLRNRLSIVQLSAAMAAAMAIGLVAIAIIGAAVVAEIDDVTGRWRKYELEGTTKLDSLADLRIQVGVGSVVDTMHQYQAHPDAIHRDYLDESLRLARANLDAYRLAGPTTEAEDKALAQVSAALDSVGATSDKSGSTADEFAGAGEALAKLDGILSSASTDLARSNVEGLIRLRHLAVLGGGLALMLLSTVTAGIAWQSRRRVVAPLARLVEDSRRLAALQLDGGFDWPGQDEIGELGRTLDGARRNLRDLLAENEEKSQRLAFQATHDPLTGLPNRIKLIEWLGERLHSGRNSSMALLFLDLDGFKMINDSLGHSIGDKLLIEVGQRLSRLAHAGERVVRLGGDEFVVTVDLSSDGAANETAKRIERAFAQPFPVDGMELSISTSIGVAIDEGRAGSAEDLLRDADIALYRAKEGGRGRTVVFDVALREAVLVRHRLHSDLDAAIARDEIFVVYQPIIRLADSSVAGFESLIRWRHPELGPISPAQFVPIAEETGAILKLGRFVLERAAADLGSLREKHGGALSMNVNFSPRQMWDELHTAEILDRLGRPDAAGIKIEVTESLAMTNPDSAREILERFRAIGVPLCIDDFGTGYSSLSYLGRFPFTVLKLDKSFIEDLGGNRDQERLVKGVIHLAHDLGLEVVAEGIELEEERQRLVGMGCDYGQGYLFAKPLPLASALSYLEK